MKRAIVLSGGGARGAYQMGAWKALRKMHIKYDLVTGTSIGALNGCMMVQKDYKKCLNIWQNMSYRFVFDEEVKQDGMKILKKYADATLKGGIDVSNIEKVMVEALDIKRFYKSKIDFGLITVRTPDFKPLMLTKNQIKEDDLKEYLMASATCFPVFQKKKINEEYYIDGGYYDNLPLNLAIDMGADEIIAIDLSTVGFNKKPKKKVPTTIIKPRNKVGSFLFFDNEICARSIRLGYNDTMKVFHKLDGDIYTFKHHHIDFHNWWYRRKLYKKINNIFDGKIPKKLQNWCSEKNISTLKLLEYFGKVLSIDDSYCYAIHDYQKKIKKSFKNNCQVSSLLEQIITNKSKKKLIDHQVLIEYLYGSLYCHDQERIKKEFKEVAMVFPEDVLAAIYLSLIK